MLSSNDKNKVITALTNVLGSGLTLKGNELAFHCPFCNHHKPKLQVNTETQKWHCWNCNSGGKKLTSLLRKLDVDRKIISIIREIYGDTNWTPQQDDAETKVFIQLPKEFISLSEEPKGFNPEYKHAMFYLTHRGISMKEIIKYNIGYCKDGLYARRVIIPSYDLNGQLNYFVSRSYYSEEKMKYKNPPISKNIIGFESQVNWNEPIILCEGVFDAITIKRNAIPLLGKFVQNTLMGAIKNTNPEVYICLDSDAQEDALVLYNKIKSYVKVVRNIKLDGKDAGENNFQNILKYQKNSVTLSWESVLKEKLSNFSSSILK